MQFVYNNNVLDNNTITKIIQDNKVNVGNIRKNFGVIAVNNKLYFVKTINKNAPPTLITNPFNDKEIEPTDQVVTYLQNNKGYVGFFVNMNCICQIGKYDYYI